MPASLYEHLVTRGLAELPRQRAPEEVERTNLEDVDAPLRLSRHVAGELFRALRTIRGEHALERQIVLCNTLLRRLRDDAPAAVPGEQDVELPGEMLFSFHDGTPPARTQLPFAATTLLTRAPREPPLGPQPSCETAPAPTIHAPGRLVT